MYDAHMNIQKIRKKELIRTSLFLKSSSCKRIFCKLATSNDATLCKLLFDSRIPLICGTFGSPLASLLSNVVQNNWKAAILFISTQTFANSGPFVKSSRFSTLAIPSKLMSTLNRLVIAFWNTFAG